MKADEYEKLPPDEKEHFARCAECGEIFDRRSLDEVLFHHADHKDRPDIQYSGFIKLNVRNVSCHARACRSTESTSVPSTSKITNLNIPAPCR
jgi:hypothetical protein